MTRRLLSLIAIAGFAFPMDGFAQPDVQERIEAVRDFPDWQKQPLSQKELMQTLNVLRQGDPETQRAAMEKLALARPNPALRDVVYEEVQKVHRQHDDKFSLAMTAQINACWTEAESAATMLQRARRNGGLRYLERVLQQGNKVEGMAALSALGYSGQPQAAAIIAQHFEVNTGVAGRALAILGPPAAPEVVPLLEDPEWTIRLDAVRVLKKIGTSEEIQALKKAASDSNGLVRMAAEEALAAIAERASEAGKEE